MKIYNKIIILCALIVLASGCETYNDMDVDHTAIYPMDGEWIVNYINTSVTPNDTSDFVVLSTYGTVDNSSTQMWIRSINHELTGAVPPMASFTGKINVNVTDKTFEGSNVNNTRIIPNSTATPPVLAQSFTITNGSVVLGGYTTLTGGKADKISFTMTDTRKAGVVYSVVGFRRTFWLADEGLPY